MQVAFHLSDGRMILMEMQFSDFGLVKLVAPCKIWMWG